MKQAHKQKKYIFKRVPKRGVKKQLPIYSYIQINTQIKQECQLCGIQTHLQDPDDLYGKANGVWAAVT